MKRTHVRHERDNRRPHHYAQRDHRDDRPAIAWLREGEAQILTLDGVAVARVEPDAARQDENWFAHTAFIEVGPEAGARRSFDDCDTARLFCEATLRRAA